MIKLKINIPQNTPILLLIICKVIERYRKQYGIDNLDLVIDLAKEINTLIPIKKDPTLLLLKMLQANNPIEIE